jgi:hypothetical protein
MQLSVPKLRFPPIPKNFLRVVPNAVFLEKFSMSKILTPLLVIIFCLTRLEAQTKDEALVKRLDEVLQYTGNMEIEKVLDYTYPKLFTLVPREQMSEIMKTSFEGEEFSTTLDSLKIDTLYPVFKIRDTSYAKVIHTMLMRMKYKESPDSVNLEEKKMMVGLMESQYGKGNVRYDATTNTLIILIHSDMLAIRYPPEEQWYFVNYDEDNTMFLDMLVSKDVQEKFKKLN